MKETIKGRTYLVNVSTDKAMYRGSRYKVYTIYEDTDNESPVTYLGTYIATALIPDDKLVFHYLAIASKEN